MGFCVFNSVAIAAQHARTLGARRVLIVDWCCT
jgi:acetoin utilization deacetylase AcuC-like enzyme